MKKGFWDDYSRGYYKSKDNPYQRYIYGCELRFILDYAKGRDSILDAGCGTGITTHQLCGHFESVTGCDISEDMLAEAVRHYEDLKGMLVVADLCSLPFDACAFSNVSCFRVLSYVKDKEDAISELFRVTQPGGMVLLDVLSSRSVTRLRRPIVKALGMREGTVEHYHWYTKKRIYDEFSAYGEIKRIKGVKSPLLYPPLQSLATIRKADEFLNSKNFFPSRFMIAIEKH